MVLGLAPIVMGMSFVSLMPIFAIDVFHGGATTQGLLLTMLGVGAILGALTLPPWAGGRPAANCSLPAPQALGFA